MSRIYTFFFKQKDRKNTFVFKIYVFILKKQIEFSDSGQMIVN